MRVLVTGSNTFYGARLVQALGGADCVVTAADPVRRSCGKVSKYATGQLELPPLRSDPSGYRDTLLAAAKSGEYDVLLPSFEESILLGDQRAAFSKHLTPFLPDPGTAWSLHNKGLLNDFCLAHGIPTPNTVVVESREAWDEAARALPFPVFVKPTVGLGSLGRSRCESPEEVIEGFRSVDECRGGVAPLVQQAVDGDVVSALVFAQSGRVHGEVLYRSLRTIPDDGGISCHRESVESAAVSEAVSKVVALANWTGFAGMDFVIDREPGTPLLLDFNPRATPALQLGFVAGVDWAEIVVELANGREPRPMTAQPGLRARSVVFDVGWLIDGLVKRPSRSVSRLREFFRPAWTLDSSIDLVDKKDWRPKVAMFKYAISCIVGSAVRRRAFGDLLFHESTYDRATAAAVLPLVPRDESKAKAATAAAG